MILGSMPGGESLRRQQYYAFPQNAFWRIMGNIFDFDPALDYHERLIKLRQSGIALWDVCATCERAGSLDAAIKNPVPNDIAGFLESHPLITKIYCNGTTAGKYLKRFFPELSVPSEILPSTSPAAAIYSFEKKLTAWRTALLSQ